MIHYGFHDDHVRNFVAMRVCDRANGDGFHFDARDFAHAMRQSLKYFRVLHDFVAARNGTDLDFELLAFGQSVGMKSPKFRNAPTTSGCEAMSSSLDEFLLPE